MRGETIPPSKEPREAIPLIRGLIQRLDEIMNLDFNDPRVAAWESTARNVLDAVYGRPQGEMYDNTSSILYATSGEPEYVGMDDEEVQRHHVLEQQKRKVLLEEYVRQLEVTGTRHCV